MRTTLLALLAVCASQDPGNELLSHYRARRWKEADDLRRSLLKENRASAVTSIRRVLEEPALQGRANLISEVWREGLSELGPVIAKLLNDSDREVRYWSVYALGRFKDRSAASALEVRLKEETNGPLKREIRLSLGLLGRPYVAYFVSGLADRSIERRRFCMMALGDLGDLRAVKALTRMLASRDTWEPWDATRAICRLTGLPEPLGDGTKKPLDKFRAACLDWLSARAADTARPLEPSPDAWELTPEPELPGLDVSFAMSAGDVKALYERNRRDVAYRPERKGEELETLSSRAPPRDVLPDGVIDLTYVFEEGRLSEVSLRCVDVKAIVAKLPWRLIETADRGWTGLEGRIALRTGVGNAEWTQLIVELNFQE